MFWYELWVVMLLGLMFGSFATALSYRVPRKMPWGAERSQCPNCKTPLTALDLIPVLSWMFSGGKCRHCSQKISIRYPLIEIACACACVGVYLGFGFTVESFIILAAIPFLLALLLIDLKHYILPNVLVLIVAVLGALRVGWNIYDGKWALEFALIEYVGAGILYGGLLFLVGFSVSKVMQKEALGFGDVKFFAAAGLWLGIMPLPYFLIASGAFAVVFAIIWRILFKKAVFPFGPALITAFYCILILSNSGFYGY